MPEAIEPAEVQDLLATATAQGISLLPRLGALPRIHAGFTPAKDLLEILGALSVLQGDNQLVLAAQLSAATTVGLGIVCVLDVAGRQPPPTPGAAELALELAEMFAPLAT